MSKLTILGITTAAIVGIGHGLLHAMWNFAVDQDPKVP